MKVYSIVFESQNQMLSSTNNIKTKSNYGLSIRKEIVQATSVKIIIDNKENGFNQIGIVFGDPNLFFSNTNETSLTSNRWWISLFVLGVVIVLCLVGWYIYRYLKKKVEMRNKDINNYPNEQSQIPSNSNIDVHDKSVSDLKKSKTSSDQFSISEMNNIVSEVLN